MISRLRTSKAAKERMDSLNRALHFSSNAVLLRLAIAKSIVASKTVQEDKDALVPDSSGFEITRATLFGENEALYKYAMGVKKNDPDETFFPTFTLMHIERGLKMLEREYKLTGNKDKFLTNIINKIEE